MQIDACEPSILSELKLAYFVTLHGEVEDIALRKELQQAAQQLGLTGWTRVTSNGLLQLFVEGAAEPVRKMIADIQLGSKADLVENLVISRSQPVGYTSFDIAGPERMRRMAPAHAEDMVFRANVLSREFQDLNLYVTTLTRADSSPEAKSLAATLAKAVPSQYLGEPLLSRQRRLPFKLPDAVGSFSSECWSHVIFNSELKELKQLRPEALLDSKVNGQNFMRAQGYRAPATYHTSARLDEIELRPGIVVKPRRGSGSKGVYSIVAEDRIYNLGANTVLHSFEEFLADAERTSAQLRHDGRWIVEELILNDEDHLPNDLKMLTFYGKVAIIQEATRMPTRVCYYNRAGERIRTGRYLHMEFEGTGVLPEYVQAAEEISLKIPAPFLRIDFLKSRNGPVFGEFTPRPGNFHKFDAETDAWLGGEFARARARLTADLLKGKRFLEFTRFVETLEAPAPLANAS